MCDSIAVTCFLLSFKFIALVCLLLPLSSLSHPPELHKRHVDVEHYQYVTNEVLVRPKRAGSFDFVGAIKNVSDDGENNRNNETNFN